VGQLRHGRSAESLKHALQVIPSLREEFWNNAIASAENEPI
jgi:hypothetical protein